MLEMSWKSLSSDSPSIFWLLCKYGSGNNDILIKITYDVFNSEILIYSL
jgi:hypothetical protein